MKFESQKHSYHPVHLPSRHATASWLKQEGHDAKFWVLLLTLALVVFIIAIAYVTRPMG